MVNFTKMILEKKLIKMQMSPKIENSITENFFMTWDMIVTLYNTKVSRGDQGSTTQINSPFKPELQDFYQGRKLAIIKWHRRCHNPS